MELTPGDIAPMTHSTVVLGDETNTFRISYKSKKGNRMIFLFLGGSPTEKVTPEEVEKRLNALGWWRDRTKDSEHSTEIG